jgi:hypothetical protein
MNKEKVNALIVNYAGSLPNKEETRYVLDYASGCEDGIYPGVSDIRQQELRWEIWKRRRD